MLQSSIMILLKAGIQKINDVQVLCYEKSIIIIDSSNTH